MSEEVERKDYYKRYKGPDVYRISLIKDEKFDLRLPNGNLHLQLFDLKDAKPVIIVDSHSTGWLYTYGGDCVLSLPDQTVSAENDDLFYLRPGAEFSITSNKDGKALLVTRTGPQDILFTQKDKPFLTKLPSRTKQTVDWSGSWMKDISDTTISVAREGVGSSSIENPLLEPMHGHSQIIEIFFTAKGRSIINLRKNNSEEKIPMGKGDILITMPDVLHSMGNSKVNRTYSGTPYEGVTFKIPFSGTPVSTNDKTIYS